MIGERVRYEASCVVEDDPGMVVRHARPITAEDRAVIREQEIARMVAADMRARHARIC